MVDQLLAFFAANKLPKPTYTLIANGKDVTAALMRNVEWIRYSDADSDVADELSFCVVGHYARPKRGDRLEFSLGMMHTGVHPQGVFYVQESERENGDKLTVRATSVNFSDAIKEKRDAKYENTTISAIAKEIADRHSLKCKCDIDIPVKYIAQQDESDLNFIARLSERYDLICNIKNDTLILLERIKADEKNSDLPHFIISNLECESSTIKHTSKTYYKSVQAKWRDTSSNSDRSVKIGDEKPTLFITDDFKSEDEAKIIAKKQLERENRATVEGTLRLGGRQISAGGVSDLIDAGDDSALYSIRRVDHILDNNGWMIDVGVER